jgi:putative DNA primase/helicase
LIKGAITREGAGILNWVIEGLNKLRAQGHFTIPESVRQATEEFRLLSDMPRLFVEDSCLTGPDYKSQSADLYSAYRDWCAQNGHKPRSITLLAEDWERLGFGRYRAGGKTFWRGVGLKALGTVPDIGQL